MTTDDKTLYALIGLSLSAIDQLRRLQADIAALGEVTTAVLKETRTEIESLNQQWPDVWHEFVVPGHEPAS